VRADRDIGRWPRTADWGVPLLLLGLQLTAAWLLTDRSGEPFDRAHYAGIAVMIVLAAGTLPWRRTAPVPVLVLAVLGNAFGLLMASDTNLLVGGAADGVALYSLAVHRGRRQAVIGCLAAFAVAFAAYLPHAQGPGDLLSNEVMDAVYYLGIIAFGQLRRQRKAIRRDLRARLARIEQEHRSAAEAERERLARDLHDVAGHHLSAVVGIRDADHRHRGRLVDRCHRLRQIRIPR